MIEAICDNCKKKKDASILFALRGSYLDKVLFDIPKKWILFMQGDYFLVCSNKCLRALRKKLNQ